ncbi:MAG: response regulator [Gammaproteobacteria bacterium]|nr:response regulator [Gammaproteobacteria bacterium]
MNDAEQHTVLVVDDAPENIDVLSGILRPHYRVKAATSGERALKIANGDQPPDLVLLDIMMPGMDGYAVCEALQANFRTRRIPVIFVTAMGEVDDERRGFDVGGVDYITKPVSAALVEARVRTHLALYDQKRLLADLVDKRTQQLRETRLQIIQTLGRAAEYKDEDTGLHVVRMSHYANLIALAHGLPEDEAELLLNAAPMHDVGKIGIPDRILQKPGKLDDDEWEVMRQHCLIGAEIIGEHAAGVPLLEMARLVALSHHEKWNGAGYPHGLAGDAIPLVGRIVALGDVFDALTSVRPYKPAWPLERALEVIHADAGSHFDPDVVASFDRVLPEILEIRERYSEIVVEGG